MSRAALTRAAAALTSASLTACWAFARERCADSTCRVAVAAEPADFVAGANAALNAPPIPLVPSLIAANAAPRDSTAGAAIAAAGAIDAIDCTRDAIVGSAP